MPQQIEVPGMGIVEFPDGMSDDQIAAAIMSNMPKQESQASDFVKSSGSGLASGAVQVAGTPGDLRKVAEQASEWALGKVASPETVQSLKGARDKINAGLKSIPIVGGMFDPPTAADIKAKVTPYTGEFYEPQYKTGKIAHSVMEMAPGVLAGPGGMPAKIAAALGGGVGKVFGGDVAAGGFGEGARPYGELGGSIAGILAPNVAARAVTPIATSPERQRLVGVLQGEGVDSLTAGQRTGNKALQYAESILGDAPGAGQGASRIQQEGQRQFTEAALRRAGTAGGATPETLAANQQRLGDTFRDLSARNNLTPDNQFITDIVQAVRSYRRVPDSQQRAMVQGYVDDIVDHVNAGAMPGPQYQEMRSRLSRQAQGLRQSDPTLSEALRDMRNALDNAMARSIPQGSDDARLWAQSRQQYSAQKDIEKAASRAGEATAEGQVTPANLRNTVAANNRGAYARGEGQFSELARAGAGVMAPLPNSGTGQRMAINSAATGIGGALGSPGGIPGALAGAAIGAGVPAALGRALMSRPAQAYLGNTLLNLEHLPPARRNAIIALLSQERPMLEAPR